MKVQLDQALMIKRKAKPRQKRPKPARRIEPTPEMQEKRKIKSAGMAHQITPVIDTLFKSDPPRLTAIEWKALDYYAEQANAAHRSPIRSNLDKTPSGTGDRPITLVCPFKQETDRIERAMGPFVLTARAICVENQSLSQRAIDIFGGREHKGRIVPRRNDHVQNVLNELKRAAVRIVI